MYKITVDVMSAMHCMLNHKLFGGELCKATFVVGKSCRVFGTFRGPPAKKWMPPGLLMILRPQITLSLCLCHTQEEAEQTMTHEMVHQWVHWKYGSRKKGEPTHGERFMRKAAEINAVMGKNYVAAHGPAGCVANDGTTRPVALIELADGRTIACSAERVFTDKARRHIKKVGDSLAGVVSVKRFRTRCPKAAWLPSANRTKVKIRNRRISVRWPIITDKLRDELLLMSVGKILETNTSEFN